MSRSIKKQKEGKGRNQPGCDALPTSVFNLVNAYPRPRYSSDVLSIAVSDLCFLPAQGKKGVKETLAKVKTSGKVAPCTKLAG